MAEYRLTPKTVVDLEATWLYSVKQWGVQQAERYIDDLTKAFGFLAESPKSGMVCENIRAGYRKHPVIRHIIYYRETDYGIEVMRVLHDRMLATRYL